MHSLLFVAALFLFQDEALIDDLQGQLRQAIRGFEDPQDNIQLPGLEYWKQLEVSLEKVIADRPSREWETVNFFIGGMVSLTGGRIPEAISEFERGLAFNPNEAALFRYVIGLAQTFQKQYRDAEDSFKTAIALRPGWARPHGALAALRLEDRKYREAETEIRNSLDRTVYEPAKARQYLMLAQLQHLQGRSKEAISSLENAIGADPSDIVLVESLGLLRFGMKDTAGAIQTWRKALTITDYPAARRNLELVESGVKPSKAGKLQARFQDRLSETDPSILGFYRYRAYAIAAKSGDTLRLRVDSNDFKPFTAVLSATGKMVGAEDVSSSYFSLVEYTFISSGTYYLLVTSSIPLQIGQFTLSEK